MIRHGWRSLLTVRQISFYLIFHLFHIGIFALGWWVQATNPNLAQLNRLSDSVWISRGAALCLTIDCTLILLPMCRNLLKWIRPKMRFLPLDESQWFHRQVAYSLLFWTIIHSGAHYVNFFNIELTQLRPQSAVQIHYTEVGGITGHVMLLCMLLMYTTAHAKIRQQSYEAFWYTHHLFIIFFLALYTHATGCFVRDTVEPISPFAGKQFWQHCLGYEGWRWELVAGGIYFAERLWREIRARRSAVITKVIRHPRDAVEIQIEAPSLKYKAGQWLFIKCPDVSREQWHPFTITSCPFDPYVSIHVRQVGDWTRAFADALGAGHAQDDIFDELDPEGMYEIALQQGQSMPRIQIDGPYGAPAEDVFENEVAILVGTGIGVTPWASILKNIWHLRASPNPPRRLRRVEFIWVCRDTSSFEWFQALLASLEAQSLATAGTASNGDAGFLRIHTYLTQRVDFDTAHNIVLNSVGEDKDPLTQLRSRTNFGRPDFHKLLPSMRDGILDHSYMNGLHQRNTRADIGVYYCGPKAPAREIKEACKAATTSQVRFKFWKEHF